MKIIADQHIPFLVEAVQKEWPQADIIPLQPEQMTASAIRDADVLVVRTRTKVDASLLSGSSVRLVCTATIGYDHIDTAYCEAHGIRWMACPGCNAQAVCDYIEESIKEVQRDKGQEVKETTIGIVGVGHVGSLVAKMAAQRGMNVLLNDPPKGIGVSLEEIAHHSDIITFHVPLVRSTYHLCDEKFLSQCKPGALIINAARGGVADEAALLRSGHPYILDTWENEPDINKDVLAHALRASMHIAGYSVEGKRNATQMCLNTMAEEFGWKPIDISEYPYTGTPAQKNSNEPWLAAVTQSLKAHPEQFESLRRNYPLR